MRAFRAVTVTAAIALAIAGCSTGDEAAEPDAPADSAPVEIPDGWHWVEGGDIPEAQAEPQLPVTVTDATGAEVTIDDASRIIVGGDDVAAILGGFGMADLVAAAPTNSASQVALDAPVQFEFSQATGTEGLLSVDGTLFIGNNPNRHGDVAAQFREAGVAAVVFDDQQSVADKIRDLGTYLGVEEVAEGLAADVEAQLEEAATVAADDLSDLRILQVTSSGAGGADAVVGTGTAGADIVASIGAVNVGVEAGLRGYSVEYSDEGLLDARPDVILVGTADLEEWGGLDGFLQAFPTLMDTPAGQAGNFVVMPSEQIKVSGPATGAGALALAQALVELSK